MKQQILIKRHPFGKDFLAINLFGFIFTRRPLDPIELNHELIHSRQQRRWLYLPFFVVYGMEWLVLYFKYHNWIEAYRHIHFEKEAYDNQSNLSYLN